MSTDFAPTSAISDALLGKVRSAVLALLFCHADESYYLREIARRTGLAPGAVQRELAGLTRLGLALRTRRGNQVYFRANAASPVFPELRGLLVKTAGVADLLRAALRPLADQLTIAFLYGSLASGTERAASDVDVMVVGQASFAEVVGALAGLEETLGREVNPSVYSPEEVAVRLARHDHFLTSVLRGPKIALLGDPDELGRTSG
jgi:predicted nucleotidyltransferase